MTRTATERTVLAVHPGDKTSPLCRTRGVEAADWGTVEGLGCQDVVWMEAPRVERAPLLFGEYRATRAVFSFLRDTRVGHMVTVTPPRGNERGGKGRGRIQSGRGTSLETVFFLPFLCFIFSGTDREAGGSGAPYDDDGAPHGFAEDHRRRGGVIVVLIKT